MKGVSGIIAAMILFAMLFAVGGAYFLFAGKSNQTTYQAAAARQDALLQGRSESLVITVALQGANTLVLSATNTGGIPTTISSIFIVNATTGKTISPPGVMGQSATNISASQWPLTLNVGAATAAISGCKAGQQGCNIGLTGYTYSAGSIFVRVVTGRGNIFSISYPPILTGVSSSSLVVAIVASPTPPLTQVFTCTGCVTVNVTAYNFALNPITGASLVPSVPVATATGTASLSNGNCAAPTPSSNIPAYSGSGTPPSISFICTFDAQTGSVGGFASFSDYVQGVLKGVVISSAQAVSNTLQIGGNSNVNVQGAFSINFFYFRSSSCVQVGGGNWHLPCTTNPPIWPPLSINNLPPAAIFSGGSNYYPAFYVQITNNYPAPLAILKYTFLQLDASHPPPLVGNETDFWLAGGAATYNSQGHYYPTYSSNPTPTLAAFGGDEKTCAESGPLWTPSANCIDIAYGQSVTLTFAACGFGSSNWDWGGYQYASRFDNSAGCTSSAPAFSNLGSADVLTVVIGYLFQGQIYTQAIQFQGLSIVP
jgi:hypothetical protein